MTERSYYVETSVWGTIPIGQPQEMRRTTLQFLQRFPAPRFYVSPVVMNEIKDCPEQVYVQIMRVLQKVGPESLLGTASSVELAEAYIAAGIVSIKKRDDALHVAIATIHDVDVLVSWNHRHIANVRKTEQYRAVNLFRGYRSTPAILTPYEVLYE